MRLNLDLIERSPQQISAVKLRTLDLRGNHIEVLENLAATKDHFECLDLSDNNLIKLGNIPTLLNLHSLVLANNHIQRIAADALDSKVSVPKLSSLVLTRNKLKTLTDLLPLRKCKSLERLTLLENDVTKVEHYRAFVVYLMRESNLKILDFQKITQTEKEHCVNLFEKERPTLMGEIAPERVTKEEQAERNMNSLTREQHQLYSTLISQATTPAEIDRLEEMYKRGEAPPVQKNDEDEAATATAPPEEAGDKMEVD